MTKPELSGTRGRKRVYLMRHGEVSYRRHDGRTVFSTEVALTEEGVEQARHMRELLAPVPFDLGAHTGLTRTRQTAELVLEGRGVRIEEVAQLREIQAGSIEHLSDERIDARSSLMAWSALASPVPPSPVARALRRSKTVSSRPSRRSSSGQTGFTALVVGHGGTNAVTLAWVTRGGLAGRSAFEQGTGCVNIIDADTVDGGIVRRSRRAAHRPVSCKLSLGAARLCHIFRRHGKGPRWRHDDLVGKLKRKIEYPAAKRRCRHLLLRDFARQLIDPIDPG